MHLIEITPMPCMVCGAGNTPTNDGSKRQFIDLERDTFWDDPAVLCEDCAMRIAGLIGAPSGEEINGYRTTIRELREQLHSAKTEIDATKRRARKLGIEFVEAR
jgi:hypothetical protein